MGDETAPARTDGKSMALLPPKPVTVVIVTGIFGQCIGDYLLPFSDGRYFDGCKPETSGYEYLHRLGYDDIKVIVTPGRSSAGRATGRNGNVHFPLNDGGSHE